MTTEISLVVKRGGQDLLRSTITGPDDYAVASAIGALRALKPSNRPEPLALTAGPPATPATDDVVPSETPLGAGADPDGNGHPPADPRTCEHEHVETADGVNVCLDCKTIWADEPEDTPTA